MEKPEIDLILFDLDGTLLRLNFNSEKTRDELHDFYLSTFGIDEYFKPVLQKIRECEGALEKHSGAKAARTATNTALGILEKNERAALRGAKALSYSKEAVLSFRNHGIKTGIFSRTARAVVLEAIEKHGLGPFDIVLAREDTDENKPSPDPILLALAKFGINPGKCIVVGDHPYDILSGKRAGVKAAGVLTGVAPKKDLIEVGADYIFKDLKELVKALL
jgi:phosphoglycolate phosphatase